MKLTHHPQRLLSGFSIYEMFLAVSVIGIMAGVSVPVIDNMTTSSREVKLKSDLAVLNSAVKSYLLFGGKLEGGESLAVVLTKLKSRASDETADQVVGLRGSFLDPRYEAVMQTEEEAATDAPRAHWDSSAGKFVTSTTGPAGVKKFRINNEDPAQETELIESRETAMQYAHNSTWIWDYQDSVAPSHIQATPIAVALDPGSAGVVPPIGTTPASLISPPLASPLPPAAPPTILLPPVFTIPPGTHPIANYDLSVGITDPNLFGSSIFYSVDFGSWIKLTGLAVTITPGNVLKAQAVPLDMTTGAFLFSTVNEGTYSAGSSNLLPPVINLSGGAFNLPSVDTVNVSFTNLNKTGISRIDYRLNGGSWQTYTTGNVQVKASTYPDGVVVEAYAVSIAPYWLNSSFASSNVGNITPPPNLTLGVTASTAP